MHPLLPSYSQLLSADFFFWATANNSSEEYRLYQWLHGCVKRLPYLQCELWIYSILLGKENGVLQQRNNKNTKTNAVSGWIHPQHAISANGQQQVPRKIRAKTKKNPPLSLTIWFQAWNCRISESLSWVLALGDHLVYLKQSLARAIQGPVKSSHEYFQQSRVQFFMLP